MKRKILGICTFLILLLPIHVNAASATIRATSASTAIVGSNVTVNVTLSSSSALGSWEILVNYDSSRLKLVSSNMENGSNKSAGVVNNGNTKSKTYSLTFKTLKSGNASVSVGSYLVYDYNGNPMSISLSSSTIKLMTKQELEATYSKDNTLKGLTMDGYSLVPDFSKDVLDYKVTVPSTVTKIKLNAIKTDSRSTISGDGEHEVNEGTNKFPITVTAQNGDIKVYNVIVEVEDLSPIEIEINDKKYTIVKRKESLTKPSTFEDTTLKINDIEVPAFKNELLGYNLVGIKEESGKIFYAIYNENENTYAFYIEVKSDGLVLSIKDLDESLKGYEKTTLVINDFNYSAFQSNQGSEFYIVTALNIVTGEKGFYVYDQKEKTFGRYDGKRILALMEENQKNKYVIIGFAGFSVLLIIILVIVLVKRRKNGSKTKMGYESKTDLRTNEFLSDDDKTEKLVDEIQEEEIDTPISQKRSIWMILSFIVSVAYFGYLVYYFFGGTIFTLSVLESLGDIFKQVLVYPHAIILGVGIVFSLIGLITCKNWANVTAFILYIVSALFFPLYSIYMIPIVVLGMIGFIKQKRINKGFHSSDDDDDDSEEITEPIEKQKKEKKSKKLKNKNIVVEPIIEIAEIQSENLSKSEALKKVDAATKIIEEYEKTIRMSKEELREAKQVSDKKETKKMEETMFDIMAEDKRKKKKNR